jgi:hypothetical protein
VSRARASLVFGSVPPSMPKTSHLYASARLYGGNVDVDSTSYTQITYCISSTDASLTAGAGHDQAR